MLGYSGNSTLLHRKYCKEHHPPAHNFYLVLKTGICLTKTKLKAGWVGYETLVEPSKGEGTAERTNWSWRNCRKTLTLEF